MQVSNQVVGRVVGIMHRGIAQMQEGLEEPHQAVEELHPTNGIVSIVESWDIHTKDVLLSILSYDEEVLVLVSKEEEEEVDVDVDVAVVHHLLQDMEQRLLLLLQILKRLGLHNLRSKWLLWLLHIVEPSPPQKHLHHIKMMGVLLAWDL